MKCTVVVVLSFISIAAAVAAESASAVAAEPAPAVVDESPEEDIKPNARLAAGNKHRWAWTQGSTWPCSDAVWAGVGADKRRTYVGRVQYYGHLIPALVQYSSNYGPAVFTINHFVQTSQVFEVLCGDVAWARVQNAAKIPSSAIIAGNLDGTPLFACRTSGFNYPDLYVSGYVEPSTGLCRIPSGRETYTETLGSSDYEVLIEKPIY